MGDWTASATRETSAGQNTTKRNFLFTKIANVEQASKGKRQHLTSPSKEEETCYYILLWRTCLQHNDQASWYAFAKSSVVIEKWYIITTLTWNFANFSDKFLQALFLLLDGTIKKATEIMHCDVFGSINMTMSSFRFLTLSFTIIFWKGLEEFRITFTGKWQTSIFNLPRKKAFSYLSCTVHLSKKKYSVVVSHPFHP